MSDQPSTSVLPLPPPDRFHLSSALGWLGLGNAVEAEAELNAIAPEHLDRLDVLAVKWDVFARLKRWPECLEIADRLVKQWPCEPTGWIDRSYALHELDRTREAHDNLVSVAGRFEKVWTIPYNIACYACQLGDRDEARKWLRKAFAVEDKGRLLKVAMEDPDLEPMREEVGRIAGAQNRSPSH
jgi:tetratricopeptide (TPR) repeat protein